RPGSACAGCCAMWPATTSSPSPGTASPLACSSCGPTTPAGYAGRNDALQARTAPPAMSPQPDPQDARALAMSLLLQADPVRKAAQTRQAWQTLQEQPEPFSQASCARRIVLSEAQACALPGRPERPRLVPPKQVPSRTPFTPEGRAALLHAICHIEFN